MAKPFKVFTLLMVVFSLLAAPVYAGSGRGGDGSFEDGEPDIPLGTISHGGKNPAELAGTAPMALAGTSEAVVNDDHARWAVLVRIWLARFISRVHAL